jgi:hypothetical protein
MQQPMRSLLTTLSKHRYAPPLLVLASVMLAAGAYLQALNAPFVSDDSFYITGNYKLASLQFSELWRLLAEPFNPYEFLPLRDFSYWLDINLFGTNPAAFRLHNLVLYVICCLLVYAATLRLWRYFCAATVAAAPWAAATVAALFAIQPAHVEAVVWASGRKDILSGLFAVLAIWLALGARRERGFSAPHAAAALIALLAAMLSKATAVMAAPVVALLWLHFWLDAPKPSRRVQLLAWPLVVLLLAFVAASVFSANSTVKLPVYFGAEAFTRAAAVLGWMLRLAISPQAHHYAYPVFEDPWLPAMALLGAATLLVAVIGALRLRNISLAAWALPVFVLLAVPYLQFSPYITHSLVSDRFVFLAAWPVLLFLVALAWRLKLPARAALLLVFALPFAWQTVQRPRDWASYEALIAVDQQAYPGYFFPVFQRIENHLASGEYGQARQLAGTINSPEVRAIAVGITSGAQAVAVDSLQSGDARSALARLQNLGVLLKRPLPEAQWNTPLFSYWLTCRGILSVEWETLARNFPNDPQVRQAYRAEQEGGF